MKKIMTIFGAILFASVILTSCGGGSTDKKEETMTEDTLNSIIDTLKVTDNSKNESANTETSITSNKLTCTEKESKNEDGGDPILTKTCLYKKYKTISKGYPDYKGRYSYEYSVFKKQENGSYVDDDKINFSVTFGLSGACMSVDGTIISFNLDEIQKYLNE